MAKESKRVEEMGIRSDLEGLKHKSTRMEAAVRLGEAGAVEAIAPLLDLCKRVKEKERGTVVQSLARMGGAAVSPLVEVGLGAKSAGVRCCAISALASMGTAAQPAYEDLLKALEDRSERVRMAAIEALGRIGDPRAAERLLALLEGDDSEVRERAAEALGVLGQAHREVGAATMEVARQADVPRTRAAAFMALGLIGGARVEDFMRLRFADRSEEVEVRGTILTALQKVSGAGVVPLAAAALGEEDARMRRRAVRCLYEVDDAASSAQLMTLYADEDKKVRAWALRGLWERRDQLVARVAAGDIEFFPALLAVWRAAGKKQAAAKEQVAQAVVGVGQPVVPALVGVLDPELPGADVIGMLEEMGAEAGAAYEALVGQLDHPDVDTCCAAARALGALGDERAVEPLSGRLSFDPALLEGKKHKQKRAYKRALALQRAAAMGLGRLGKASLVAALDAAHSDRAVTRQGGAMALGYIGGGRALSTLDRAVSDPVPAVREAAAEALERAAAKDVARLGKMLGNGDERVRARAVKALGELDDLRSLDLLLRAYGDPSERVSKAVVHALAQREGERSCSILIAAAAGGNVTALRTLTKHPNRQAIPALLEALDAPWFEVYGTALEAIQRYAEVFGDDAEVMSSLRRAIPELTYLLHDESAKARRLALKGVAAFHDPATVQDIAYLLLDDKEDLRLEAVHALSSIGGAEAVAALRARYEDTKDEDLRTEIGDALSQMGVDVPQAQSPEPV